MRKNLLSVEQIVAALRQAEMGMQVAYLCRTCGREAHVLPREEAVRQFGV